MKTRTHPFCFLLVVSSLACGGPLGPFSGGALSGDVAALPQGSLEALPADVETVQLETNPEDPYSVNVWWLVREGRIYVPTSLILGADEPTERRWVRNVLADPRVRLRVAGTVYELRAVRVEDSGEVDTVRGELLAKYDEELDPHARQAWIFRMEPR